MATDAGGTRPLTQRVAGNGQSTVDYQLPAGLFQYIQSVVATVDTSASGEVSPLLTIRDDAGIVVADKQQGDTLDAGGSGRATWALRLTDEAGGIRYNVHNKGTWLAIEATGNDPSTGLGSIVLAADVELRADTPFFFLHGDDTAPARIYNFTLLDVQCDAVNVLGSPGGVFIEGDEGGVFITASKGGSGGFSVADQSGQLLFTVDQDGALHGRTGKTLTFDL